MEEAYCQTVYVNLPEGGIFKVPLLEVALDEVVPEYELVGFADGDTEMVIINFCHEHEAMVHKAVTLVYGEPYFVTDLP